MAATTTTSTNRIVFLDVLRIFAFSSVLIGHLYYPYLSAYSQSAETPAVIKSILQLILPFTFAGGAGIVVFFLVSGYIITHVLVTETPAEFLVRRVFRIYPLYIVAVSFETILKIKSGEPFNLMVFIGQCSLFGDFFNTPYALGNVEWTLRVEILFYLIMAFLKMFGVLPWRSNRLSALILIGTPLFFILLAPFPSIEIWSKGYVTIYGLFLFLGVAFYLREREQIARTTFFATTVSVMMTYYYLISVYQPNWIGIHFAALSVGLFFVLWCAKQSIYDNIVIRRVSDMTFAVYLFHFWLYRYLEQLFSSWSGNSSAWSHGLALLILLVFCYFVTELVEKPMIRLGRITSRAMKLKTG